MIPCFRVLLYIFVVGPHSVTGVCAIFDDDRYPGLFVNCSLNHLTNVPDLPFSTTSADLSSNFISVIKDGCFFNVSEIRYLDLSHNVLTHLEPRTFQSCHLLEHLDLSYNKLALTSESFPGVVFDPLVNLRWLNMKYNQKGDGTYPERIFQNLGKLTVLSIGAYRNQRFGSGFRSLHGLKELYIGGDGCSLNEIRNTTFLELASTRLEKLEIFFCRTEVMEAGSLTPLTNLTDLTLHFLYLGTLQTFTALAPLEGRLMNKVQLQHIGFPEKPKYLGQIILDDRIVFRKSLKHLANLCVKTLQISENFILWLDWMYLAHNRFGSCIEEIYASSNQFTANNVNFLVSIELFSKLRIVDMSRPSMMNVNPDIKPKYSYDEKPEVDEERKLSLIPYLEPTYNVSVPQYLTTVNISAVTAHFGEIRGLYNFLNGEGLINLNFSFLGIKDIDARITGLDNLKVFDLSGNMNLHFKTLEFLSNFPHLEELRLSYSSFQQNSVNDKGHDLLKLLPSLKRLYLRYNQLYVLPSNLFDLSSHLEYVDLSGNHFSSIPFNLDLLPEINVLDMSFNAIGTLTKKDCDMINTRSSDSFFLSLRYNLFACGCGSIDFLLWLSETRVHLDNGKKYACIEGSGEIITTEEILNNFLKTWRKCTGKSVFFMTLVIFTILVASILGTRLVQTNKTYLIYLVLQKLHKQFRIPKRSDFDWDVYVSYAEKDYHWICHSLCPGLEARGLTLYINDRDSVPGDSIPDQIVENICKSWKILLYFSTNYETDEWSYMVMMAAINRVNTQSPEKLILLLPEEERPRLPRCLLEVVPESCIFLVPADSEFHEELFVTLDNFVKGNVQN